MYWKFTEQKIESVEGGGDSCEILTADIIESNDGTIRFEDPDDNPDGIIEYQLEMSGDILTVTVLENPEEPSQVGENFTFKKVDGNPRDLAGCE